MCGICGTYDYRTSVPPDPEVLSDMLSVLYHRGPDEEGVHLAGGVGLGMRRLSIIDLPGGHQPIANEDGTVIVVFNGEIYNYRELRSSLAARGHRFSTNSDTEVIVHLYEDAGDDCVQALRGMFGFAIWDARRQRMLIARDRLGIKPVYYCERGSILVFGSEIKAILQHPDVPVRLNAQALGDYLSLKYVPAPQTIFEGIHALPPAHILSCDRNGVRVREYWRVSYTPRHGKNAREAVCSEELEALLADCVRAHLVSDVPFGAFLSGGLDSSTIVALMSQELQSPVKTFSVGFRGQGEECSELPYARLVADRYGTDHNEVIVGARDLTDGAERVLWHLDQPIADNACLANYMLSAMASRHVKMVLTGEGGDELFAGYARYSGERLSPWFRMLPGVARRAAVGASERLPGLRRPKLALFALCQADEGSRLVNWFPLFNSEWKARLLSDELGSMVSPLGPERAFQQCLAQSDATDPLNRMLCADTKLWLADDLLARGDKMCMANSLEARVPLLDHKLVEFAASLPPGLKIRRLTRKYLFRNVARKLLPPEIIERRKQGFPMPFATWFRDEARPMVRDLLSPETIRRRGLFNPGFVQRLIDQHELRIADHSPLIWGLLSVELWHRVFLDTAPRSHRRYSMMTAR